MKITINSVARIKHAEIHPKGLTIITGCSEATDDLRELERFLSVLSENEDIIYCLVDANQHPARQIAQVEARVRRLMADNHCRILHTNKGKVCWHCYRPYHYLRSRFVSQQEVRTPLRLKLVQKEHRNFLNHS